MYTFKKELRKIEVFLILACFSTVWLASALGYYISPLRLEE